MHSHCYAALPVSHLWNFPPSWTETLAPINTNSPFPLPTPSQAPSIYQCTFWPYEFDYWVPCRSRIKQYLFAPTAHTQLLIVCDPIDLAQQAPLSMGFSGREYCWFAFSSPGPLSDPGIEPASPALAGGFSTTEPRGSTYRTLRCIFKVNLLYVCEQVYLPPPCSQGYPVRPH